MAVFNKGVPLLLLSLLFFSFSTQPAVCASPPQATLHHLPLTRKPLSTSRLFALSRRPWFNQYYPPVSHLVNSTSPFVLLREPVANRSRYDSDYASPLHGSITPMGEYYVTLTFCGQAINVQIDTGSSTMAVPLKECTNCLQGDNRLDLSRQCGSNAGMISCDSNVCGRSTCSSACGSCSSGKSACCSVENSAGCAFRLLYADKSGVTGALVQADVAVSTISTPLIFGGILSQNSFEADQVDGIFGLAFKTLACNPSCVLPLMDTLMANGDVAHDIFSICTGSEGGVLTMGGSNPALYNGKLSYVPFSKSSQNLFYKVDIPSVSIGGTTVDLPSFSNGIIDSGTTLLVISKTTYDSIRTFFQTHYCHVPGLCVKTTTSRTVEIVPHPHYPHETTATAREASVVEQNKSTVIHEQHTWFEPGYCVDLSTVEIAQLPTISLHLDGFSMDIEPQVYMIPHLVNRGLTNRLYHCLGIASLAGMEFMPNDAIIGDTVLQKYFVEYDRENNRLGFAVAKSCVDPTAREPQEDVRPQRSHPSGGILSILSSVPKVFWYILALGLVLIGAGRLMRRSGYETIDS